LERLVTVQKGVMANISHLAVAITVVALSTVSQCTAQASEDCERLFARDNLVAWCIVPFDSQKRTPEHRADMLQRLGFRRFAYDWRAEHLPTFERELLALKEHEISLDAVWFPAALNDDAKTILDALKRHRIKTQLWMTMGDVAPQGDQAAKVASAAAAIKPIAEEAAKIGCQVALYNHGGWFGEPENQLAIIDALGLDNVGIVYNLHHGHEHLDRFETLLKKIMPHLLALNLNGMTREGDRIGKKVLPLAQGEVDLPLLRTICASGYHGPIGILGHTMDDAEARLQDNLDGLDWLVARLANKAAGPKPTPRTPIGEGPPTPAGQSRGRIAEGKPDYRQPPLTVECRVKLLARDNYNILVASDTKASGSHWEVFSMAGSGTLTAYLPGMKPDHVHSQKNIVDGGWHDIAMLFEARRVRLLLDGEVVADQAIEATGKATVPGGLAIGRLVEGGLGCNGEIAYLRLSKAVRDKVHRGDQPPPADGATIGLWIVSESRQGDVEDKSRLKNRAQLTAAATSAQGPTPEAEINFDPLDSGNKVTLIDRSRGDAYMAVKADSEGRVFVGAREAVYLFELYRHGEFKLRQEVCRLPADSIAMGLEFRGDDLYVLTANALYLLPNGRVQRGVNPQRILWGLPLDLHVSFHCLAWGPEGDLYLTHGDPLLNYGNWNWPDHWGHWTLFAGPNGEKVSYTGVGAVLRMRPDGSRVKVVAGGLRGPVGLAFDPQWNLFTNDNDHESRADLYAPARLLHVTPHIDFAWPRGWMASKSPRRFDLVEPVASDLGRGVPCDLVWYDDGSERNSAVPLAEQAGYGGLLMARWDRMAVNRYAFAPRGASVTAREELFVQGRDFARPVGIAVGPDGRLFLTALYLGGNVWSPHCVGDLVALDASESAGNVEPYNIVSASAEKLWEELSHPYCQRRMRAHQEILRRGGKLLEKAAARLAQPNNQDPALVHLPWLAGASGSQEARQVLIERSHHPRAECRLQAIRALAEFRHLEASDDVFIAGLSDSDLRIELAALGALFDGQGALPLGAVARLATSDDTYLRQTAAKLLASRATGDDLARLTASKDSAMRRAAVLAIGFCLTVPPHDFQEPESLPLTYDASNASFALKFADTDKPVDLRALGRVGSFTTAEWWKAVPPTSERRQLFDLLLAALDDEHSDVVEQSAYFLSLLKDGRAEPLIAAARRRVLGKEAGRFAERAIECAWILGPTDDSSFVLEQIAPPDREPVDLSASYSTSSGEIAWSQRKAKAGRVLDETPGSKGSARAYVYFQLQTSARQAAAIECEGGAALHLWHNGHDVPSSGAGRESVSSNCTALELQPGGNDLLLRVDGADVRGVNIRFRAATTVVAAVPERTDHALLTERLKQAGGTDQVPAELLAVDWSSTARQGDVQQGRKLFGTLGCAKCHGITLEESGGGAPNLADLRRRFNLSYVVESILVPSRQVADPFRGTTLVLSDGRNLSGLVVNDTLETIDLLLPDTRRASINKADIDERFPSPVSPMPSGLVKTESELRDLLAYLFSERPTPP
jgi:putative heme-binding domain-containing protein